MTSFVLATGSPVEFVIGGGVVVDAVVDAGGVLIVILDGVVRLRRRISLAV